MAAAWAEKRKLQEQLASKLEGMRARKVVQARATQSTARRSLPLGTR